MEITIRQSHPHDIPALLALDPLAPTIPDREQILRRAAGPGACFVAESSGSPVGYAVLDPTFFGHTLIALLFVHPDARRRGVASALLARSEAACTTPKLFTSTNLSNTAMQTLLAQRGFRLSGFIENLDEGDPELIFFKPIPAQANPP